MRQKPAPNVWHTTARANQIPQGSLRVYGKRRVGGKAVDHKGELRTIAVIRKMYSEGVSTAAIARTLATMQIIPTKRQGKGWDHSMVTAILRREGGVCGEAQSGEGKGTLLA